MPVSRLAASFGDSVSHELSQDHVQAFLARYKLVVCMNLFVLCFLCICSGFFSSSSSNSGMGNYKRLDGNSKSYPSYMDYQTGTTTTRSSSSLPAAAGGRLRGLSRRDKEEPLRKASASLAPPSSSWASSTHVPQRPPPRFVPGTLPQSKDKPVVAATSDGAATATAETASEPFKSATISKTGASNGSSKKRALLSSLASSTKQEADMLTSAAEALEETAPAPASLAAADALEQPVDAGMMPTYAEEGGAPVQCTFSGAVGGEEAMLTTHDDRVLDAEGASDQNVRAPSTEAEKEEEAAVPMAAFEEVGGTHVDPSVSSLCPLTPPSAEAQGEPAVEVGGAGVEEAGVSLNPDVDDAERDGLAALAMEATEMERVDERNQQMEEEMVAMPLLRDRHHPLEYIPPFAREDVFC